MHTIIAFTLKEDIVKFNSLFNGGLKVINEKKKAEKKAEKEKVEKERAEKAKILGSIVKSCHMVLQKPYQPITGKIFFPDFTAMANKTSEELKKMRVSKIGGF
jgi:hypothetical protein